MGVFCPSHLLELCNFTMASLLLGVLSTIFFAVAFGVYALTAFPTVPGGDSGEVSVLYPLTAPSSPISLVCVALDGRLQ